MSNAAPRTAAAAPLRAHRPAPVGRGDVQVLLDKNEALLRVFPSADKVLEVRHLLSGAETRAIEALSRQPLEEGGFYTYRATRDGHLMGYAVVVSQVGKVHPITHIVGVTPEGQVGRVAVMIYRESHGGEVTAERFLDQYRGLSLADPVRIDADIVNIAGATLSGHAICRGVRKALATVEVLFRRADSAALARLLADARDVTPQALTRPGPTVAARDESVRWDRGGLALRVERSVMGSLCSVELRARAPGSSAEDVLLAAARAALDEVARWDDVLSDWKDTTPLSELNLAPVGRALAADADLMAWLEHARWAHAVTAGAFDPTLGALGEAWGLHTQHPSRPAANILRGLLDHTGMERLALDAEAGTVTRLSADVRLDPGASGKGWALDRAAAVLERAGVTRALLSFRSTLLALDPPPGEAAWNVPVVHDGSGAVVARIPLVKQALSVSGGALAAFDDGGIERGHVIDPATGVPVSAARLAWVTHPSAATADALSTALLVAGPTLPAVDGARGAFLSDEQSEPQPWPRP